MTTQYRYGETDPVSIAFNTTVALAHYDLSYLDSGDSYKVKPAGSVTWVSAPSTPSAPTVAASAATRGTALTNAATGVKVAAQYPWGEGALSTAGSATPTAAFGLKVTLAALPTYATAWNVYVEDSAGSGNYLLQQTTTVSAGIIYVDSYGTGAAPSGAAVSATTMTQYSFMQTYVGVAAQPFDGSNVNAYGIKDGKIRVNKGGVYDFTCASASFNVGDKVGVAKASGNALDPQKVVAVTDKSLAVGRVVQAGSSVTTVRIEIDPPLAHLSN